jgi:hypothetical protein
MLWQRMLAYITGSANEDLLCEIEYPLETETFCDIPEKFNREIRALSERR